MTPKDGEGHVANAGEHVGTATSGCRTHFVHGSLVWLLEDTIEEADAEGVWYG